jgi:hypothetical protein
LIFLPAPEVAWAAVGLLILSAWLLMQIGK